MPASARQIANEKKTINRGWQEDKEGYHQVDKAQRKHAQRGGSGEDCCKSNNYDRAKGVKVTAVTKRRLTSSQRK
jgi:hypothetical protein